MRRLRKKIDEQLGESVVDEVRAIREELDGRAGHDVRKLAAYAQRAGETIRRKNGMTLAKLPIRPEAKSRKA
jgi:hypothetical protein